MRIRSISSPSSKKGQIFAKFNILCPRGGLSLACCFRKTLAKKKEKMGRKKITRTMKNVRCFWWNSLFELAYIAVINENFAEIRYFIRKFSKFCLPKIQLQLTSNMEIFIRECVPKESGYRGILDRWHSACRTIYIVSLFSRCSSFYIHFNARWIFGYPRYR